MWLIHSTTPFILQLSRDTSYLRIITIYSNNVVNKEFDNNKPETLKTCERNYSTRQKVWSVLKENKVRLQRVLYLPVTFLRELPLIQNVHFVSDSRSILLPEGTEWSIRYFVTCRKRRPFDGIVCDSTYELSGGSHSSKTIQYVSLFLGVSLPRIHSRTPEDSARCALYTLKLGAVTEMTHIRLNVAIYKFTNRVHTP